MVQRREVIGGGLAAGLAALFSGATAQAAQTTQRGAAADDGAATARAIDALREMLEHRHESPVIRQIRSQQRTFLKANQKFPDFIDVGIDVWERMHDWHVENRLPLAISRMNDGHYEMAFAVTTLVLQPQQTANYVSWGYDAG